MRFYFRKIGPMKLGKLFYKKDQKTKINIVLNYKMLCLEEKRT